MIDETIQATGYNGDIDGQDIYEDICDQIEDKEPGSYLLMSKKTDDVFFEYQVDVMEDQFNLGYVDIHEGDKVYHANFD